VLHLQPGPGLTLIVGRNGSGKSSFAEAAELAVTGSSRRWSHNTAARAGWRNIHAGGTSRVAVGLAADGQTGTMILAREWPSDAGLEDAAAYVQEPGARREPGSPAGWSKSLELYRPFLSYSELGTLVDGKPSEMYDALQAILPRSADRRRTPPDRCAQATRGDRQAGQAGAPGLARPPGRTS